MQDDPFADLSHDEKKILADLAKSKANGTVSRRDLLQAGGALGVGAALGAAGSTSVSQPARAATNQAGTIGSSSERDDWFAEDIDATSISTGEIVSNDVNGVTFASENDPDLPTLSMAISNATAGETVVLVPGDHSITSTVTVSKQLNLVFYGTLVKQADVDALVIDARCHMSAPGIENQRPIVDGSQVADTTSGIVYHSKFTTSGDIFVQDVGGIGHHLHQASTGDNLNNTVAQLNAVNCGGDGIKTENTTADPVNLNAMVIASRILFGCGGDGFNYLHGFGNRIILSPEGNTGSGLHVHSDSLYAYIPNSEANFEGVTVESTANSVRIEGRISDGYTNNNTAGAVVQDYPHTVALREISNAGAANLVPGDIAFDPATGRLVWKDQTGSAYYVAGTTL